MADLLLCLKILVPIFLMVAIGYFLRVRGHSSPQFIENGTHLLFYIILPCSLFMNLYNSDFSAIFNPRLVLYVVALHAGFTGLAALILPRFFPQREQCGIVVQGAFRGNILLLGLPLAHNMYGDGGMGPTSLIMAYSIPLYNILAVVVLSIFSEDEKSRKIHWGQVLIKICKNPLVLGTALALPFAMLKLGLPRPVTDFIAQVGAIGSPLGLILLGAQMRFSSIRRNKKPLAAALLLKLLIFPVLGMGLAILLGFSAPELGAVFILVSAPMSISSFIMANSMSHEGELAGQMVFLSTALSMFTLLGGLYLLRLLHIL